MANYPNPSLSGISQYIDQSKEELLTKVVLGGKSIAMFQLMPNTTGAKAIHYLDSTVVLADATDCGFYPQGSDVISQRIVKPVYLKAQKQWCEKNLLDSYIAYKLKSASTGKVLPYEEDFLNQVSEQIQEKLERMVWFGDSAQPAEFDGIIKIAEADGAQVIQKAKGTSIYSALKDGYLSLPEEVVSQGDLTIFVSDGVFRNYIQELVALNYFHITGNDAPMTAYLPGTSCKIVAVHGLNGGSATDDVIVFARTSNIVYVTDMMSDSETFDFWFSQDDRTFKLDVEFWAGVQLYFPDEVTILKITK